MAKFKSPQNICKVECIEQDDEQEQEQEQEETEPLEKIPRLQFGGRKQKFRKCKKVPRKIPQNICDLPTEILEKIIGHVNIWHHNRIRGTSKRMKEVDDMFVMHEFQRALKKQTSLNPNSDASASLRVRPKDRQTGSCHKMQTVWFFFLRFLKIKKTHFRSYDRPVKCMCVQVLSQHFVDVFYPCYVVPIEIHFVLISRKLKSLWYIFMLW